MALVLFAVAPARAVAVDCDRACLMRFAQDYIEAVRQNDPTRLQYDQSIRFTENNVELEMGYGHLATVTAFSGTPLFFVDERRGEVGLHVVVVEGSRPAFLSARLRVEEGKVRQLETAVLRRDMTISMRTDTWESPPATFTKPLAPADRTSRGDMIALANGYLRALTDTTAPVPVVSDQCLRFENGAQTSLNPQAPFADRPVRPDAPYQLSCAEQFKRKILTFINAARDVRHVIVDEEQGLIYTVVLFDHHGRLPRRDGQAAVPVPTLAASLPVGDSILSPYSYLATQIFKIVNGRIEGVAGFLSTLPYGTQPYWK